MKMRMNSAFIVKYLYVLGSIELFIFFTLEFSPEEIYVRIHFLKKNSNINENLNKIFTLKFI